MSLIVGCDARWSDKTINEAEISRSRSRRNTLPPTGHRQKTMTETDRRKPPPAPPRREPCAKNTTETQLGLCLFED